MKEDLFTRFARVAAGHPNKIAIEFCSPDRKALALSYERLFSAAAVVAKGFRERGVEPGDRVALQLGNSPEFVITYLAILHTGATLLPLNTAYTAREVDGIVEDAEPKLTLREQDITVGWGRFEPRDDAPPASATLVTQHPFQPISNEDLALLMYTSGTTGKSKGAMLSHRAVGAMIDALHQAWEWSSDDRLLLTLPLFHMHGLVVGLHCALAAGATVLLEPRFDAARALDRLAAGEATMFFGVPTLYVRLIDELKKRSPRPDLSRVRLFASGSAPLAAEVFDEFEALTGQRILERYGMTETGMLLSNPLRGRRIAGTVGRPLPGVEMRIDQGEVQVRGPNLFSGYWRAPEKTAESFAEGVWFRTGDLGEIDPESGHLRLLGRSSELILSGGFNVYPREVEEVLLAAPGVLEAAVVGIPHSEFGQSPVAFLVVEPGSSATDASALAAHCRVQLAAFKCPRRFEFVDALPRNAMGKIEKKKLAAGYNPAQLT